MNKENIKNDLELAKTKLESLGEEFEKNPSTAELAMILYVVAGTTLIGKEAMKSLAVWNASWADKVLKEIVKMREDEAAVEALTNKLDSPKDV